MSKQTRAGVRRLFCALLAALLLLPVIPAARAAQTYSFHLDYTRDIEIILQYEGAAPAVQITGPGNATFSADSDFARVDRTETAVYYYLKDAPSGDWRITTDKAVTYTVLGWYPSLQVDLFTMENIRDGRATVHAQVTCDEDQSYDWYIYAQQEDASGNLLSQQLLTQTSGRTNQESTAEVDLSRLPDGSGYRLMMEAVVTYPGDVEDSATATTATTFTLSGNTQTGNSAELLTELDLTEELLTLDWSAVTAEYDEMALTVYDDAGTLLAEESWDPDVTETRVLVDLSAMQSFTVELHPILDGYYTTVYSRTVSAAPGVTVSIDTPETTAGMMASISYDAGSQTVPLTVERGGAQGRYQITGSGSLSIELSPMDNNDLVVRYEVGEGCWYRLSKTIAVSSLPPRLLLYGVSDGMKTDQAAITLSGTTDPGTSLTVAGSAAAVDADGSFSAEVALSLGENPIELICENESGVRTVRTVTVYRVDPDGRTVTAAEPDEGGLRPYWPLMFAAAMALIAFLSMALAGVVTRKRGKSLRKVLLVMLKTLAVLGIVLFAAAAGYSFYQMRSAAAAVSGSNLPSVLERADYAAVQDALALRELWRSRMISMLLYAGVCLGALILLIVLDVLTGKLESRRRSRNTPPPPRPATYPQTGARAATTRPPVQRTAPGAPQQPSNSGSRLVFGGKQPAKAFCPHCGAELKPGTRFCGKCGKNL